MSWTGNVEENFKIWFQKFEFYLVATEKTSNPNNFKYTLVLHWDSKKAIEVFNEVISWHGNVSLQWFDSQILKFYFAQSAGTVEYTDCFSAEG